MLSESKNRQGELNESIEPEVFRKCLHCKTRPASIRCAECQKERGVELLCYGCSRKAHTDRPNHNYVYATFKDMLLTDEYRSTDTEPIQRHNVLEQSSATGADSRHLAAMADTLHSKNDHYAQSPHKSSYFRDTDKQPMRATPRGQSKQTSNRKDYQTFGYGEQAEDRQPNSKNVMHHLEQLSNKENLGTGNFGAGRHNPNNGHSKYMNPKAISSPQSNKEEQVKQVNLKPVQQADSFNSYQNQPSSKDYKVPKPREPFSEAQSYPEPHNNRAKASRYSDEERVTGATDTRDASPDQLILKRNHPEDHNRTPIGKTPATRESRLLAGSNNKSRKVNESHSTLLHSPMYVESITELHRTEIESLKTKHRVEIERLQHELTYKDKECAKELKHLKSQSEQMLAELTASEDRGEELEKVVRNLKTQNSLLKEENELLRANASDNSSKEQSMKEEVRRLQRDFEGEAQRLRAKNIEDINMYYSLT